MQFLRLRNNNENTFLYLRFEKAKFMVGGGVIGIPVDPPLRPVELLKVQSTPVFEI